MNIAAFITSPKCLSFYFIYWVHNKDIRRTLLFFYSLGVRTMLGIDLNIDNYTLPEVEKFLKLDPPYSLNNVLKNEKMIVGVISKDSKYDVEEKAKFMEFIKKGKLRLAQHLRSQLDKTIQNNQDLPEEEFVIERDKNRVVNQTSVTEAGGNSFVMNQETTSFNNLIDKTRYLNPVESFPTNIARSDLNHLKRKTITQTVILNSLFREDYKRSTASDFNLVLPYQFKNVLSIRLSSIQLPNVLYCFSKQKMNNMMYIKEGIEEDAGEGMKEGTIVLPDGNYEITELAKVLEQSINEQLDIDPPRFVVTANTATRKIQITNKDHVFTMNFLKDVESIDFNSTLGWILGYRNKVYECSAVYETEGVYNNVASDYIFFVLNDFNNSQTQNILAMYSKSYIGDNILAMIPLTSNTFHVCFDSGNDFIEKKRDYFGPVNLQRMKVELRNQYGEILDMNSMDFSFSLEVEMAYDI